jgi:CheY-like chemotaxis protein
MKKSVLVVEDDASVRDYLSAALETVGRSLRVRSAANGREASDLLAREGADLVLTDLNMPEMNGVDLVRHVRVAYPGVLLILMSGASGDWQSQLQREGLDELPLLTKPVSVSQLVELVHSLLDIS